MKKGASMSQIAFNYQQLNMLLRIFFFDALKIALKNPRSALTFLKTLFWLKKAGSKREKWNARGLRVPPIIILSITQRCNLSCQGCYAQALHEMPENELSPQRLLRLFEEASELGVSFFVVAGGEPFLRPELLEIAARFPNIIFLVFTNGLLIDAAMVARLKRLPNVVPLISLEGGERETDERRGNGVFQSLMGTMAALRRENVFFGTSLTLTHDNFTTLTDDVFIGSLFREGIRAFFLVEYTPVSAGTEHLVVGPEQRQMLKEKIMHFRKKIPALFISLPQDEEEAGGCLAAGRGFIHISAQGAVEPCPFSPFSDSNIREQSLQEALDSKLLKTLRQMPGELHETGGGCILWQKREWVKTLLGDNSSFRATEYVRTAEPAVEG
jgi:MoaA/NifB/PqqE/SkfB family radical SAM enzyme